MQLLAPLLLQDVFTITWRHFTIPLLNKAGGRISHEHVYTPFRIIGYPINFLKARGAQIETNQLLKFSRTRATGFLRNTLVHVQNTPAEIYYRYRQTS